VVSLTFSKRRKTPSEAAAEVIDIDVTPVMNMFIILIPFLVSMAVFTHLTIIDFSLPPNVGAGLDTSQGKPKLKITVVVTSGYVAVTHGEKMLDSIPMGTDDYDYDLLYNKLLMRRQEVEIRDEVIVAVQDPIRFKHVVKIMDRCRDAGFDKVGLSSAPENAEQL
jgi:biopolymer transport protein ExbD